MYDWGGPIAVERHTVSPIKNDARSKWPFNRPAAERISERSLHDQIILEVMNPFIHGNLVGSILNPAYRC